MLTEHTRYFKTRWGNVNVNYLLNMTTVPQIHSSRIPDSVRTASDISLILLWVSFSVGPNCPFIGIYAFDRYIQKFCWNVSPFSDFTTHLYIQSETPQNYFFTIIAAISCTLIWKIIRQQRRENEWVIVVNAKWAIFQIYNGENKIHSMRWWCLLCTRPTRLLLVRILSW